MGPRLFSRGNFTGTNGVPQLKTYASMGPRLFSRGNWLAKEWGAERAYLMLQWGHDFSAVEILPSFSDGVSFVLRFNGATTFQPWKWRPFFALYWHRKMGRFREVRQYTACLFNAPTSSREYSQYEDASSASRPSRNHITSRRRR